MFDLHKSTSFSVNKTNLFSTTFPITIRSCGDLNTKEVSGCHNLSIALCFLRITLICFGGVTCFFTGNAIDFLATGKIFLEELFGSVPSYFLCLEQYVPPDRILQPQTSPALDPFAYTYGQVAPLFSVTTLGFATTSCVVLIGF